MVYRSEREIIIAKINNCEDVSDIELDLYQADYDVMYAALSHDLYKVKWINDSLLENEEFALNLTRKRPDLFYIFPHNIKNIMLIALCAVKGDVDNYQYLCAEMQLDINVLTFILSINPEYMAKLIVMTRGAILKDAIMLINLLGVNIRIFKYIVEAFGNDHMDLIVKLYAEKDILDELIDTAYLTKEIIIDILKIDGMQLRHLYSKYWCKYGAKDYDICYAAINNHGSAILYVDRIWRCDLKLAELAIKKSVNAYLYIHTDLLNFPRHKIFLMLLNLNQHILNDKKMIFVDKNVHSRNNIDYFKYNIAEIWELYEKSGFDIVFDNKSNYYVFREKQILIVSNYITNILDTYYSNLFGRDIFTLVGQKIDVNAHFLFI